MIRDRVNSGLARARANGVEMGRGKRKDGTRSADEVRWGTAEMEKRILSLRNEGKGILKIGRELGVGTALVQRVLERASVNWIVTKDLRSRFSSGCS